MAYVRFCDFKSIVSRFNIIRNVQVLDWYYSWLIPFHKLWAPKKLSRKHVHGSPVSISYLSS